MPTFQLKRRVLWHSIGVAIVALVWYLSLTSAPIRVGLPFFDKATHMLAYLTQTLWYLQLYRKHSKRVLIGLAFIAMGLVIEYIQSFHPMRYFDIADMLANTLGVVTAYLLSYTPVGRFLFWCEQCLNRHRPNA